MLKQVLRGRHGVAVIGSEEKELSFTDTVSVGDKRFAVLCGPVDGSPNINVSGEVITTFSIYAVEDASPYELRPDTQQIAAGYVLYSSSTIFDLTTGNDVHMFALDTNIGAFIRATEHP